MCYEFYLLHSSHLLNSSAIQQDCMAQDGWALGQLFKVQFFSTNFLMILGTLANPKSSIWLFWKSDMKTASICFPVFPSSFFFKKKITVFPPSVLCLDLDVETSFTQKYPNLSEASRSNLPPTAFGKLIRSIPRFGGSKILGWIHQEFQIPKINGCFWFP